MEEYKLTKEERDSIKNIFKVAKRAKMRIRTSINEHDLLGIMREEKSKIESKKDINIGLTLKSDLEYCNQITPALETIAYGPTTEGTKEAYFAEKLIPYVKKYQDMLVKAIKLNKEDEEYIQQLRKWEKTGKPEDFPYRKGRTRSEELQQQDKESLEQMKKYHEAKDKTGLELPIAEGLNAKPGEDITSKEKPEQGPPIKRLDIKYLIKKTDGDLIKALIGNGITEPGLVLKSYAICKNNDLQIYEDVINYCNEKKLTTLSFSINDGERIFTYIKPKFTIYSEFNGTLKIRDNETFRTTDFYQKQKK